MLSHVIVNFFANPDAVFVRNRLRAVPVRCGTNYRPLCRMTVGNITLTCIILTLEL